jgi:CDP-4-dehydro-6-deoxyglucose reductase
MQLTLRPQNRVLPLAPGRPVLESALAAHFNLPHSCKGGSCGSCRARILSGQVDYPRGPPLGLSAAEAAAGYALLCQAVARTDLVVEAREVRAVTDVAIKSLPARIERLERLAPDVMGVFLRLPVVEEFRFRAGQYLDVMLPGGRRRSFSIASPPHDAALLELHVRRVAGGAFTTQLFESLGRGALLRIEGPLGQFVYRAPEPATAAGPVLLVAGGTGFAPLKAILRQMLEAGDGRAVHLYWGARAAVDLYQDDWVRAQVARFPRLSYVPVLSAPQPAEADRYRTGLVHAAVLADLPARAAAEVYAAGPPALIAALRQSLPQQQVYFDSFEYAPDARPPD